MLLLLLVSCKNQELTQEESFVTIFETSNGKQTPTYQEVIDYYIELAREFPEINIQTMGLTDSGMPLHIVTYNKEGNFNFAKIRERNAIILINNGIHPGESDGIDATMMLFRDMATEKITPPKRTVLVTIPIYNIGGALNRNSTTRSNQNGPEEYGFRGNARNYDLNRDFIKGDTQNSFSFAEIFHLVKPDVFIDNHVSNGADYQYTLTHLFTQHNKLGGNSGSYLHKRLMPELEDSLAAKQWDITPYVNVFNRPPEVGFSQFMDFPRYSTGYASLWNTFGLMVETHMLKPYKKRVMGTYELLKSTIEIVEKNKDTLTPLKRSGNEKWIQMQYYPIQWIKDTTQFTNIKFKGYEVDTLASEVTGLSRLLYDRSRPFEKTVKYENYFIPSDSIEIPYAYLIPKGWYKIKQRLEANGVSFNEIETDTIIQAEVYKIAAFETASQPYEGHYPHFNTKVTKIIDSIHLRKGDLVVETAQPALRYLLETLEPQATDSFFNWNFFDTVLQQKEGFSPYVFEDEALKILQNDSVLNTSFLQKKKNDTVFANSWYAQLEWVYKRSPHYEKEHMTYPIFRIPKIKE
ncbi:M14 family metallopeptidase [Ascidiimonas sp. W6]|uniref:M14 family metallopeptidase n=1 Tax=Ascidiimonas meishanensis TaxID=3128903 RepID=UPI0030EDDFD2